MNDNDKKNKQELTKLKDDKLVKNSKKKTKTETKNTSKKTKSTSKKSSSTNTAAKKKNTTTKNKTISNAKTTNTVKKNNEKKIESKDNTKKEISSKINKEIKEDKDNSINKAIKEEVKDNVNNISIDKTIEKENKNIIEESLENKNDNTVSKTDVSKMEKVTTLNTNNKKIKSPKSKKDVIKETSKKISNEKIVINDNSLVKNKNYKNELKDINNNKEFAKAIWDTDDITEAIKIEANNQEKLNNEIDEMLIKERKYNSFEPFIIIILLILCFLGLYFILFTKDSAIINSALTNINNNLTSSLSELNTIKEELNKGITGTATLDTTSSLYASLKDFTYDFSLYNKNNNFYGNIKLSKDDKTINNTYSYLDKNLYIATPLYYFPIQINNPIKVNPLSINLSNDKFLIYVDDIKLIDIKSNKNKNDLINLDFQVSNILNNYQGSVVLTKFDNNKGSFLFSFKDTNNNDVSAEIKMDLVFGDIKGNDFDYTDAVLIDDITEDELLDIKNNLFNAIWDQVSNPEETVNNNNEEPSN